jgi:hypothetical protein
MCKEWEEIPKMNLFKRKDFVLLARRKTVLAIGKVEKTRETGVEESERLEEEIKNLQGTLKMRDELEDATEEIHDAVETVDIGLQDVSS